MKKKKTKAGIRARSGIDWHRSFTIIETRSKSPDSARWARRTLAVLLSSGGNSAEALALLESGDSLPDPTGVQTAQDRRTRASLLAVQNSRSQRRAACVP